MSERAVGELVDLTNKHELDILALQEVDFDSEGNSRVLDGLKSGTSLTHSCTTALSPSALTNGRLSGLAIASRFELGSVTAHKLPNPELQTDRGGRVMQSFDKGVLMCEVELSGSEVLVASVHGFPFHRFGRSADDPKFRSIWRSLADQLTAKSKGRQLVVGGDFNTAIRDLITARARRKLFRAVGDVPTHGGLATDDILFSAGLTLSNGPDVVPNYSDHHFCVVELAVE